MKKNENLILKNLLDLWFGFGLFFANIPLPLQSVFEKHSNVRNSRYSR